MSVSPKETVSHAEQDANSPANLYKELLDKFAYSAKDSPGMNRKKKPAAPLAGFVLPDPPPSRPLTVCFQTSQPITHSDVLRLSRDRLARRAGCHVTSIQHVIGHVLVPATPDRWLVTVNNERAKKEILRGLFLGDVPLVVRALDDVLRTEHMRNVRYQNSKVLLHELQMATLHAVGAKRGKKKNHNSVAEKLE